MNTHGGLKAAPLFVAWCLSTGVFIPGNYECVRREKQGRLKPPKSGRTKGLYKDMSVPDIHVPTRGFKAAPCLSMLSVEKAVPRKKVQLLHRLKSDSVLKKIFKNFWKKGKWDDLYADETATVMILYNRRKWTGTVSIGKTWLYTGF